MYIRIEFENLDNEETKNTQFLFRGSPNGTCLSSYNSQPLVTDEMRKLESRPVAFWHLDVAVLNEKYGGVRNCLNKLAEYPGVKSVDVLAIDEPISAFDDRYEALDRILMKFYRGVGQETV